MLHQEAGGVQAGRCRLSATVSEHGSKVNPNKGRIKAREAGWQKEKGGSWEGASMTKGRVWVDGRVAPNKRLIVSRPGGQTW